MKQQSMMPSIRELGTDLLRVTRIQRALSLAYPFVWCAAYFVFAALDLWPLAIIATMGLSFVTYGSTSHDLVHRNLGLPRLVNDILLSLTELLAIRSGHAYQAAHLHHHARFPAADDVEATAAGKSLVAALLDGISFAPRIWLWVVQSAPAGRAWIVAEGAVCASMMISALIAYSSIPAWTCYVVLMTMGSWVIPLVTSYLPHDPEAPTELTQTRAFRGVVASMLAVEHLYHLEHHLYPAVPHVNWPTLARRLDPYFAKAGVEPTVFWF